MGSWDDSTKFRNESIRTILFAILAFFAAIYIVKPSEKSIEYQAFLDEKRLEARQRVVDDFLRSSWAYAAATYDILNGSADANDEKLWKGELVDRYRSDMNRLLVYFGVDFEGMASSALEVSGNLYDYYKEEDLDDWEDARSELKRLNNRMAQKALTVLDLTSGDGGDAAPTN